MIQKLKNKLAILLSVCTLALPLMVPAIAHADPNVQTQACAGATTLQIGTGTDNASSTGCPSTDTGTSTLNHFITIAINIFSVIVGVVAVIMIVFGAFRYITSGGDSTKVGNAKNTILYAIIGLVIVALAQIIVQFVLDKSVTASQ